MVELEGFESQGKRPEGADLDPSGARNASDSNGHTGLLKTFPKANLTPVQVAFLTTEYKRLATFKSPHILQVLDMQETRDSLVLAYENFDGIPLDSFLDRKPAALGVFLNVSIQLASALEHIHGHGAMHGGLRPGCVLIHPGSGQVKISGAEALFETQDSESPFDRDFLEKKLPYTSPEKTGRTNRVADFRTDFYSLGIIFYEMLTGAAPFTSDDPLALLHWHLAKTMARPSEINPQVPTMISDIVMKLTAKNADERYQSALGLQYDLQCCLLNWQEKGQVEPFVLGTHDVPLHFHLPHRLYGREAEAEKLRGSFERVASGAVEVVLLSGEPGVGKSALADELRWPVAARKGYFVTGKYEGLSRDVPFSGLIQAFGGLIKQILTESEERTRHWKERLQEALGRNGQIIVDVIAETALILGEQPPVAPLPPTETQNRFNLVFQRFASVFSAPDHPLVLFLDDLQWADPASLNLVKTLVFDPEASSLLFIGAYRDREVNLTHPLTQAMEGWRSGGVTFGQIRLEPLEPAHLTRLMADTMHCPSDDALELLTRLVHRKTEGNPFFVKRFLKVLYESHVIYFDPQKGWRWDTEKTAELSLASTAVDLMRDQILRLSRPAQEVLKLSACIGSQFDLETLAGVGGLPVDQALSHLQEAIREDLIFIAEDSYKFLHNRVQEAAHALLAEDERKRIHLRIGTRLLQQTPEEQLSEKVFSILNQLNRGADLISRPDERIALARLNLKGGTKARGLTAYDAAAGYLAAGMGLLPEDSWQSDYDLTRDLCLARFDSEFLNGNYPESDRLFEMLKAKSRTDREKAVAYKNRATLLMSQGNYKEAVRCGLRALRLLDQVVPNKVGTPALVWEIVKTKLESHRHQPQLPPEPATHPQSELLLETFSVATMAAYFVDRNLFTLTVLKSFAYAVGLGNTMAAPNAYCLHGMLLGSVLGSYQEGHAMGRIGLEMSDRGQMHGSRCFVNFIFGATINHWTQPVRTSIPYLLRSIDSGLETGDIMNVGYAAGTHTALMTMQGDPLDAVLDQCRKYLDLMKKLRHDEILQAITSVQRATMSLKGQTDDPATFDSEGFNEGGFVSRLHKDDRKFALLMYRVFKFPVLYLTGQYQRAIEMATEIFESKDQLIGLYHGAYHNYYHSLTMTALYAGAGKRDRNRYRAQIRSNQQQMKRWAKQCPVNFTHYYLLVDAEVARLDGRTVDAMDLYDRAIGAARQHGFVHVEAVANELAAGFYNVLGRSRIAAQYWSEARSCFVTWGAEAKVRLLDAAHPPAPLGIPRHPQTGPLLGPSSEADTSSKLDLATVLKSSQAINREITLEKLLKALMVIVLESAGAERAFLILDKNDHLVIEAEASAQTNVTKVLLDTPLEQESGLSAGIVQFVRRTGQDVVLSDAAVEGMFCTDPYVVEHRPKSVLCTPVTKQHRLVGILYLENNMVTDAFTPERLETLRLLSSQAAISLENARLYDELETRVELRTAELSTANGLLQDEIMERRKAEEAQQQLTREVMKANADLQEADEEITSFAYIVSHDLRAPLVNIKGFSGELKHTTREIQAYVERFLPMCQPADKAAMERLVQADIPESLNFIESSVSRMDRLISSIVKLSRAGRREMTPELIDMVALVRSILDTLAHQMETHQVRVQIGDLPPVRADRMAMEQIVGNLFDDAVKYLEPGRPGELEITADQDERQVVFHFRDNGRGIADNDMHFVFELLRRAGKQDVPGDGMGLACVKSLVKRHGGRIWLESELGVGTTFSFTLPRENIPTAPA